MTEIDATADTLAGAAADAGSAARTLADARRPLPTQGVIGKHIAHFRIEKEIGRGGMGEVYLATDLALDRPVAVKLLPRDVGKDPQFRARFIREARAQARLAHPNICHIYFIGEQDEQLFFAMEYIEGENLQRRLDRDGKLPLAEAIEIARQAAEGLRAAARQGFTHRDIKPSNLIVDANGVVKLVDFGLVKDAARADVAETGASGTLLGTPLYMAPEQARGEPVDLRADIYALGVTLHHMLAGRPPFTGATPMAVVSQHLSEPRPRLDAARAATLLDGVCDRMMAKRPADRYASYDDLIAALELASPQRTRQAGLVTRAFALCIDVVIAALATLPIDLALQGSQLANNLWPFVAAAYGIFAHARFGRTLGKKALAIELTSDGKRGGVGWKRAAVRYVVAWGPSYVFAGAAMLAGGRGLARHVLEGVFVFLAVATPLAVAIHGLRVEGKRPLWDRAAGTRVVYER